MNYLSIDVGTTACKCQLFSDRGEILEYISGEYGFLKEEGESYVDIEAVREKVFSMIGAVAAGHRIDSICFSSFGETFVLLDKNDRVLFHPMIYTDKRGEEQAKELLSRFGGEKIFKITGTLPHAMYSISKLLWLKENRPEIYEKADKALLICDYFGYLLTGRRVIDYSLAARTGAFDIENLCFSREILEGAGVSEKLFSAPKPAGTVVGEVCALPELRGCKLVLGSHDQICTALGAGVVGTGQAVDGLGTVECITAVYEGAKSDLRMGREGYCCMPYALPGLYCSLIVTYACTSVTNWMKNQLFHNYKGKEKSVFAYLEKGMTDGPSGVLTLPYFSGSMIPYQDIHAKGAVVGLTTDVTDSLLFQSVMESLAMEMRFETANAKKYGIGIKSAVATGGGANSDRWLQIKADIQGIPYETLRSSEGGLCGCAVLQATALGGLTAAEAIDLFVKKNKTFLPDKEKGKAYAPWYKKYLKLYKALKNIR